MTFEGFEGNKKFCENGREGDCDGNCPVESCGNKVAQKRSPVKQQLLDDAMLDLSKTIDLVVSSYDPIVSLVGIAIYYKYERLFQVLREIKEWGLEVEK